MNLLKYVIAAIVVMLANISTAQTSLHGKRFVIKANALSPVIDKGFEGEVELAIFRHSTISIGFLSAEKAVTKLVYSNYSPLILVKGNLNSETLYLKYKYYLLNKAVPTLKGFYMYVSGMQSRISSSISVQEDDQSTKVSAYGIKGVRAGAVEAGIGNQLFIGKRIAIDYYFGINTTGVEILPAYEATFGWLNTGYNTGNLALGYYPGSSTFMDGFNINNTRLLSRGYSTGIKLGFLF